jgi:hypothetical protein
VWRKFDVEEDSLLVSSNLWETLSDILGSSTARNPNVADSEYIVLPGNSIRQYGSIPCTTPSIY